MTYIATFFTHFAAVNFSRHLKGTEKKPMLMPVPRKLSSSCGTCVKFLLEEDIEQFVQSGIFDEDVDTVYLVEDDSYTDRKSTRLNSSHVRTSRMPSSA